MPSTITSVNSSTSSQVLVAADVLRVSMTVQNTDANEMFIGASSAVSTTSYAFRATYGNGFSFTQPEAQLAWWVIWGADGAGAAVVTAITDVSLNESFDAGTTAISTYGQLKTTLAAWLKPNTTLPTDETTSRIPEYIALFEAEANRTLRIRNMDAVSAYLAVTSGSANLPTGFRRVNAVSNTTTPNNDIEFLPSHLFERLDPLFTVGLPQYYTIAGSKLLFWPAVTATMRLRYTAGITPLSADSDTNWLLIKHPDAYLYGSLINADRRLVDPERIGLIEPRYREVMRQIMEEDLATIGHALKPMPQGFVV